MGKNKKEHRKKVQNRNKRKADTQVYVQRLRGKLIQQKIREMEAARQAEIAQEEPNSDVEANDVETTNENE